MTGPGKLPMTQAARDRSLRPRFAVRISRGLVTHWLDDPLTTRKQAEEARQAILDRTGEDGEIEEVLLSVKV